jgi:O-antigen/teichoic acid export membrane protein
MQTAEKHNPIVEQLGTAVRHSAVYGFGSVVAKAIGFLMVPFYTHYLNPVDYGILEILDLSMSLLGMLLNMGITTALLRGYAGAKTPAEKKQAVGTAFLFVVLTGLFTFAAGLSAVKPVASMLFGAQVPAGYLLMSFSSLILGYITNLPRTYLRALEASGAFVFVDTASLILMLGLNILFIAVLKVGLVGILLSSLISASLQAIVLSVWLIKAVGLRFNGPLLRQMVNFGLPLIFSNLALFTLNFADRFFLKHFQSLDAVGVYAVGYKFGFMLNYLLVQPFYVMWEGRMYAIHEEPNHPRIFGEFFVLYSVFLTYAGLAFAIFSPEIVGLMVGPKFASSVDVIPIIILAYVFSGIGYFSQVGMYLTNNTKLIGAVSAGAAVLNLALNYVCIRRAGMLGAAWATAASFAAIALANHWFSQRLFPLPLGSARVVLAVVVAAGTYIGSLYWVFGSLLTAVLIKTGLLVLFPFVLWRMGVFSAAEMETLSLARGSAAAAFYRLIGADRRAAKA